MAYAKQRISTDSRNDFKAESKVEIKDAKIVIKENRIGSVSFGTFIASITLYLLKGELPHAKAVRLPVSQTRLAIRCGILFKRSSIFKAEARVSAGMNSLRSAGI